MTVQFTHDLKAEVILFYITGNMQYVKQQSYFGCTLRTYTPLPYYWQTDPYHEHKISLFCFTYTITSKIPI
jgi:hypothetical protein